VGVSYERDIPVQVGAHLDKERDAGARFVGVLEKLDDVVTGRFLSVHVQDLVVRV